MEEQYPKKMTISQAAALDDDELAKTGKRQPGAHSKSTPPLESDLPLFDANGELHPRSERRPRSKRRSKSRRGGRRPSGKSKDGSRRKERATRRKDRGRAKSLSKAGSDAAPRSPPPKTKGRVASRDEGATRKFVVQINGGGKVLRVIELRGAAAVEDALGGETKDSVSRDGGATRTFVVKVSAGGEVLRVAEFYLPGDDSARARQRAAKDSRGEAAASGHHFSSRSGNTSGGIAAASSVPGRPAARQARPLSRTPDVASGYHADHDPATVAESQKRGDRAPPRQKSLLSHGTVETAETLVSAAAHESTGTAGDGPAPAGRAVRALTEGHPLTNSAVTLFEDDDDRSILTNPPEQGPQAPQDDEARDGRSRVLPREEEHRLGNEEFFMDSTIAVFGSERDGEQSLLSEDNKTQKASKRERCPKIRTLFRRASSGGSSRSSNHDKRRPKLPGFLHFQL